MSRTPTRSKAGAFSSPQNLSRFREQVVIGLGSEYRRLKDRVLARNGIFAPHSLLKRVGGLSQQNMGWE
jgi:hypothetical protein